MKKLILISSVLSSLILFACFATAANGQDRNLLANAMRITGDSFPISTKTPKGAGVYAVTKPSAAVLDAIDKGLTDLFAVARKNGYDKRLNYSDYSVFIGKPDRTTDSQGKYSPDIAVPAHQYAGSVFDQGGFIYAAGLVLSNDPCAFVIAEHTKDLDRVSNVVRYEGEHLVLYHNDRKRYEATADHSKGGFHPILQ